MCDFRKRKQWSVTTDKDLYRMFREYSEKSRIPSTRLLDEAIEDFLVKYGIMKKEDKKNP